MAVNVEREIIYYRLFIKEDLKMTKTVKIYFDDLKPEAQEHLLMTWDTTKDDENWDSEASFFIHNISLDQAIILGNNYKQNAIVFGLSTKLPELVWLV